METPAANYYVPKHNLIENGRFNKISFGKGDKIDFAKLKDPTVPGPGLY